MAKNKANFKLSLCQSETFLEPFEMKSNPNPILSFNEIKDILNNPKYDTIKYI